MIFTRGRAGIALWIASVVVVWNAVFDRVLVLAERRYLRAADLAASGTGPYERIDNWMPSAIVRGLWLATAAAGLVAIAGLAAIAVARRRSRQATGVSAP
jgi:hypothetical protein